MRRKQLAKSGWAEMQADHYLVGPSILPKFEWAIAHSAHLPFTPPLDLWTRSEISRY